MMTRHNPYTHARILEYTGPTQGVINSFWNYYLWYVDQIMDTTWPKGFES